MLPCVERLRLPPVTVGAVRLQCSWRALAALALALIVAPERRANRGLCGRNTRRADRSRSLHLREMLASSVGVLSIGGAGVHDGIFLAGLIAMLLLT